jgi:hypothetical protein
MRDLRKYARQTNVRLALIAAFLFLVIGTGLIWLIYGRGAAGMGLLCLLAAFVPVILILGFLALLDWITKRARPD